LKEREFRVYKEAPYFCPRPLRMTGVAVSAGPYDRHGSAGWHAPRVVGRYKLTASKPEVKAPTVSALDTRIK
jgi:hypothetical protein